MVRISNSTSPENIISEVLCLWVLEGLGKTGFMERQCVHLSSQATDRIPALKDFLTHIPVLLYRTNLSLSNSKINLLLS